LKTITLLVVAIALVAGVAAGPTAAQTGVTNADIQRLQDAIYDASRDVAQARSRDAALGNDLQSELDDVRDETVYLKVKLRKNETVTRSDYTDLRDRIDRVRSRARGEAAASSPSSSTPSTTNASSPAGSSGASRSTTSPTPPPSTMDVPVGTEFDVRLQSSLSSMTAQVEDRVEATTLVDFRDSERLIVPAGSVMRGVVNSVTKAGRVERKGSVTIVFDQITIDGTTYPIRGTVVDAIESEGIKGEVGKIGAGAGIGAILGGIIGGTKGAIAGILIGGGGTIAATEGKDVELPAGTVLRARIDSGLDLR